MRSPKPGGGSSRRARLVALLIALVVTPLVWLLRWTWRVRTVGRPPTGALFAYWHGEQLALAGSRLEEKPALLVSRSDDGEWAARVARWLGFAVVRGSSSRGAVAGALALVRRLLDGRPVGLAVDGPRGPRRRAGRSASRIARCAGAPLVPVAAACSSGIQLRSWDRMVIPSPFAEVIVVFGPPLGEADLQAALERAGALARSRLRAGRRGAPLRQQPRGGP
jgi:lysophospholipid acyltransferase (LPLAT)-like uncharacterized protein